LILLTDSDGAGFQIRNFLKGAIPKEQLKQAYIPDVYGKERRKRTAGKEGKLGVEGMRPEVLIDALRKAGATFEGEAAPARPDRESVTKADLFAWGLIGGTGTARKRQALLKRLDLPEHLTPNGMLEALNLLYGKEELERLLREAETAEKTEKTEDS
jgi:ribonuclease M5